MSMIYIMLRQDYFPAVARGEIAPDKTLMNAGPLWITLALSVEEHAKITCPIWLDGTCVCVRK